MGESIFKCFLVGCSCLYATLAFCAPAQDERPNILLILADDMGYSDVGSFGGEIVTPNIDRLAANGVRFSQFYNTARCSTTRASLLSGLYPHKVQMGHLAGSRLEKTDGYRGDLDQTIPILPELLSGAGYKTAMSGKWHLANHNEEDLAGEDVFSLDNTPNKRGFDEFYGTLLGGNNYFSPRYLFRNEQALTVEGEYYYTDALSAEAVQQITHNFNEAAAQPLFLYLAYTAPHWPLQAPAASVAKYRHLYSQGWDAIRQQRHQRMIELGVINKDAVLSVRDPSLSGWDNAEHQAWEAERMAVHAAMVEHLDKGVGQVLQGLEDNGQLDNTLVVFLSDNGASGEDFGFDSLPWWQRLILPFVLDKHMHKYSPASGEALMIGNQPDKTPGGIDVMQSLGPAWANASNTPFRKYKTDVHEGGVATPLVVHWPKGLLAKSGSIKHEPGHVVDLMATLLDAAGINTDSKLDGESLMPQLQGSLQKRGPIYFEHQGNRAVRNGDWKLVAPYEGEWELYNLAQDRTETQNLAATHPTRVAAMIKQYQRYASESKVTPWKEVVEENDATLF